MDCEKSNSFSSSSDDELLDLEDVNISREVEEIKYKVPKEAFYKNIFVITYGTLFCIEFARGLFMASSTGAAKHCGVHVGAVVAAFSVGRLFASLFMGYLSDKISVKWVLILASVISCVGSMLYIIAFHNRIDWLLIVARCTHGVGSGVLSVVRSYTSKITTLKQRTGYMALNGAAQYGALGVAPFIAIVMKSGGRKENFYNGFTAPAIILVIANIINIIFLLTVFVSFKKEEILQDEAIQSSSTSEENETTQQSGDSKKWKYIVNFGIGMYIFFNFASRSVFALIETVTTKLYSDLLHIGEGLPDEAKDSLINRESGILFGYLGLGGLLSFAVTILLTKVISEEILLAFAFVLIASGSLILMLGATQSLAVLLIGLILIWSIAFPLKQTTIMSSFSKILGSKPQGGMMGWIGTIGSLGRICMPLLVATDFSIKGSFLICVVVSLVSAVLLGCYILVVKNYRASHTMYRPL